MKKPTSPVMAALAALALAFSPVLFAQQAAGPEQQQNPRANDGTANQTANSAGPSSAQPGTLEKNNSKDGASETRDANPSTAPTGSAQESTTKTPSGETTSSAEKTAVESKSASNSGEKALTDKDFVTRAAQGGMTEVELGKLAGEKASSGQVKDFGERMVKDHSQANDELKSLAEKKGIAVSPKLDARHQAQVDRLGKLSGAAFDKAYVNNQLHAHESTVALFKEEASSGQDPDLKAFANKTLPTLEQHCSSIMDIDKKGVK